MKWLHLTFAIKNEKGGSDSVCSIIDLNYLEEYPDAGADHLATMIKYITGLDLVVKLRIEDDKQ